MGYSPAKLMTTSWRGFPQDRLARTALPHHRRLMAQARVSPPDNSYGAYKALAVTAGESGSGRLGVAADRHKNEIPDSRNGSRSSPGRSTHRTARHSKRVILGLLSVPKVIGRL
jgi:hypothetical protein